MKIARQKIFTFFVVLGIGAVLTTVFFGAGSISHGADHSCVFSLMAGVDCPSADRLAMISHIFSGWRNLISVIVDFKTAVLIAVFWIFFLFGKSKIKLFFKKRFFFRFRDLNSVSGQKKKFFRWLVLHHGLY
ncbi:MAG: hypothetical protein AAB820_02395 [Patescibacteria group bacterium]